MLIPCDRMDARYRIWAQALVLRQLGLIRTDQLPDLAARWLVADMTDSPSTRMLAGHSPSDPRSLDQLLAEAAAETRTTPPTDPAPLQATAVDLGHCHLA